MLLVHLSDLHYDPKHSKNQAIVRDALTEDLKRMALELGTPSAVLFSGDLVFRGSDTNAYDEVSEFLISPVCEALGIPPERFLLAPGNHDIDTTKIDEIIEMGLSAKLSDPATVNEIIDRIGTGYPEAIARLQPFIAFRNRQPDTFLIKSTPLWSTYIVPTPDGNLGVASLNSAWRATGGPHGTDREHLIVGEKQVDDALGTLNTPLKLALVHHPLTWLIPFDSKHSGRRIFSSFDILMHGHNHEAEPQQLQSLYGSTFVNQAGCLYAHRDYYNGYSWIAYRSRDNEVKVLLREYFDIRRAFDKCTRLAPDGVKLFVLPTRSTAVGVITPNVADLLQQRLTEEYNQSLLSAQLATSSPKDLRLVFVEPPLDLMSEETRALAEKSVSRPTDDRISLAELLGTADNLLILGKRHYGRTTLLHWLALKFADSLDPDRLRVPIFLSFVDIPKSAMVLRRRLEDRLLQLNVASGTESAAELLDRGACVVLVDDARADDQPRLSALREVARMFPKCRWIISAEEDLWTSLIFEAPLDIGISYRTAHIRPLTRRQVRDLVRRWRVIQGEDIDDIVEEALKALNKMNIPVTPFLVCSVLWILESGKQLSLVNYAALLDTLLDDFLEKAESASAQRGLLDYRNREHYLAHIAWSMAHQSEYSFHRADLEDITLTYFKELGLKAAPGAMVDYMLHRGIFLQLGDTITFKYASFCRYFIAKRMIEDKSAYESVVTRDRFLDFAAELDLLSGLKRNNKDLLDFLSGELKHAVEEAGGNVDLAWFEHVGRSGTKPMPPEEREALVKRFQDRPSVEERQEMLDEMYAPLAKTPSQSIRRVSPREATERVLRTLALFSQVIRNCELINKNDKSDAVELAMDAWAQLMVALCLFTEDYIESETNRKVLFSAYLEQQPKNPTASDDGVDPRKYLTEADLADLFRLLAPAFVQSYLRETLGTPKLEGVIDERLSRTVQPSAIRVLDVLLYADLKLPGYIQRLREVVKNHGDHRFVLELLLPKLGMYYLLRSLSKEAAADLESLIGDVVSKLGSTGTRQIDAAQKNAAMAELRKRKLVWSAREASPAVSP